MTTTSTPPESTPSRAREDGRAVRKRVPRSTLGAWEPAPDRADPVATLTAQAVGRVPELLPLRYRRMLASPFAFYRGAAAIMAGDLAPRPRTGLQVQLAGDAHLANFGGFAAADRTLIFDLNDFDETLPGPFEWDVQRLAASFEVAGQNNGLSASQRAMVVGQVAATYRQAVREFAGWPRLSVWYARVGADDILDRWAGDLPASRVQAFHRAIDKGRRRTSAKALSRYCEHAPDGRLRVISRPPDVVPLRDLFGLSADEVRRAANDVVETYRESLADDRRALLSTFEPVDAARKVVGVGSVGMRCFIAVFVDAEDHDDGLVLQLKEATASVLEAATEPSRYGHHGQRVVEGQRLMQASSDLLLGWTTVRGIDGVEREFYVRQMWDWKTSPDIDGMDHQGLGVYAAMCGWTLARAHCRTGDRRVLAGYLGSGRSFDRAMQEFAASYADQNQRDYDALRRAVADGRVEAADPEDR
ncbi:DUF2252 domain-containing protein [Nocardioides sp. GY 10113]|uniref:DUF2252 domain-containing protein n=1 Tax=Nocardioides sp. GY 10113 TaxID=2569761 RepID=UPI0010A8C046|nr:DUF2252 domain-containing protein [Nocardioides sp. GY 10113]TIC79665.1 DUF2252 domain-containing protein [Nocardioides sp. GY 10113]TIC85790.1 DUF2252 domain-containing protein [Nocardioides sp. GY 10113]